MFNFGEEKETNYGSPLIAAALAAKAGLSFKAGEKASDYLSKSIAPIEEALAKAPYAGVTLPEVGVLKKHMLDKKLKDLPVLAGRSSYFAKVAPDYLPSRAQFDRMISSGGYNTVDGLKLDPLKVVKDARKAGGYINVAKENPIALAHELGHATMLNPGAKIRGSKLYDTIELASRKSATTRNAALAAILAGSFDSDDPTKWVVPGLVAASQVPVLAEEGIASVKAYKALKDLAKSNPRIATKTVLENMGPYLRRAFGTYGAKSLGLLAAPVAAISARSFLDDTFKE